MEAILYASPEMERIAPPGTCIETVATGFQFTEGPVWTTQGALLFSDIPANRIYRWTAEEGVSVFRESAGLDGTPDGTSHCGSNGLCLDRDGSLLICQHGNRRVTRLEGSSGETIVADRFEGRRLNSPNDVVCDSAGAVWFTDPPYGLPQRDADLAKELSFNGVYRVSAGRIELAWAELTRPNGLAFSPDESVLYVSNSDPDRKLWMRFEVNTDGYIIAGDVFYDATSCNEPGLPDGMKLDAEGNLYCTGPGGIWVFSPSAQVLGKIRFPEVPANCQWGGPGAQTLHVTARTGVYRVRLGVPGLSLSSS